MKNYLIKTWTIYKDLPLVPKVLIIKAMIPQLVLCKWYVAMLVKAVEIIGAM